MDYLHARKFPILGPLFTWTLRATTVAVLVGVYQFNTNDIGVFPYFKSAFLHTDLCIDRLDGVDCESVGGIVPATRRECIQQPVSRSHSIVWRQLHLRRSLTCSLDFVLKSFRYLIPFAYKP